jgi:hypothetical protein
MTGMAVSKERLKKSFATATHAAMLYGGSAVAWYVPGSVYATSEMLTVLSGKHIGMLEIVTALPADTLAIHGGLMAAGAGAAALGYARVFSPQDGPKRDKMSHLFNYAAASLGAAVSAVAAFATMEAIANPVSTIEGPALTAACAAAISLAGFAGVGAGYKRVIGRPAAPKQ